MNTTYGVPEPPSPQRDEKTYGRKIPPDLFDGPSNPSSSMPTPEITNKNNTFDLSAFSRPPISRPSTTREESPVPTTPSRLDLDLGTPPRRAHGEDNKQKRQKGVVPGGLTFLSSLLPPQDQQRAYQHCLEGSTYHTVKGKKRHGLLYDPGASSGIIGTDTVRDYVNDVLDGQAVSVTPSEARFTGIDGEPTPGLGKALVPLRHPLLRGATFSADMIGGAGSYCPGLFPLSTSIKLRATMFAGVFDNDDGILALTPESGVEVRGRQKPRQRPIYLRLLHTDSGHYLMPIDDTKDPKEIDQQYLHKAVMDHLMLYWDPPQDESNLRTQMLTENNETTPLDIHTGAKIHGKFPTADNHLDDVTRNIIHQLSEKIIAISNDLDGIKKTTAANKEEMPDHQKLGQDANPPWWGSGTNCAPGRAALQTGRNNTIHLQSKQPVTTKSQHYYKVWSRFPGDKFTTNIFPSDVNVPEKAYKGIPEKFYLKTGLPVITPNNAEKFLLHLQEAGIAHIDFQEVFSGSSTMSMWGRRNKMTALFPIDLRYGWNLHDEKHRNILDHFYHAFRIGIKFFEPECTAYSIAATTADPDIKTSGCRYDPARKKSHKSDAPAPTTSKPPEPPPGLSPSPTTESAPTKPPSAAEESTPLEGSETPAITEGKDIITEEFETPTIDDAQPSKMITIQPNFDLGKFKQQLEEAASESDRLGLLLGFHLKFWHATPDEMARLLSALGVEPQIIKLCPKVVKQCCEACRKYAHPLNKPAVRALLTTHFNERVQGDLFFLWDKTWLILVDEHIRYKLTGLMINKTSPEYLRCLTSTWIRFFGPMETFISDQEGALTSDLVGTTLDRFTIKRELAGTDPNSGSHTTTGLAESHIRMTKAIALKNKVDAKKDNLQIDDEVLIYEATMAQNLMLNYGGSTPANALLGFTPKDFYDTNANNNTAYKGVLEIRSHRTLSSLIFG